MILIILIGDAALLAAVAGVYFLVIRRRARIHLLVELLAALARNGLPLHTALRMLGRDFGGVLGLDLGLVAREVEEGRRLDEAFDLRPRAFPPLLRAMVRIGCRSGNLGVALERARASYRHVAESPSRSVFFFLYPVLLCVSINAMVGLFGVGIGPKFRDIFASFGLQGLQFDPDWLAWTSQGLMVAGVMLVIFVVLGLAPQHFGASPRRFRGVLDRLVLRVPWLAGVARHTSWSRFAFSTAMMLEAGGTMDEAVDLAAECESNGVLRARMESVSAALREGIPVSGAIRRAGRVPEALVWFLENGEASGAPAEHLLQAAEHFDARVRFAGYLSTRLMVPLMIALNGLMVAAVYLVTMFPFIELTSKLGG